VKYKRKRKSEFSIKISHELQIQVKNFSLEIYLVLTTNQLLMSEI